MGTLGTQDAFLSIDNMETFVEKNYREPRFMRGSE